MYFILQRCMFCFVAGAQHAVNRKHTKCVVVCCHSCFAITGHWRRSYGGDLTATAILFQSFILHNSLTREMCWHEMLSVWRMECSLRATIRSNRMKIDLPCAYVRERERVRACGLCVWKKSWIHPKVVETGCEIDSIHHECSSPLWVNMCVRCSHCSNEKFGRKMSDYKRNIRENMLKFVRMSNGR